MKNPVRELTEQEKRRIRQLVTQKCANFHEEYGCLPLDCDC
nr:cysteine-rich VLP protein [Oscillospiraceae bacterium]